MNNGYIEETKETTNGILQGKAYIENGNVLVTIKKDGSVAAIVGEHTILFSYQKREYANGFSADEVRHALHNLKPSQSEIAFARKKLMEADRINPHLSLEKQIAVAREYLAKIAITKKNIAEDLGIPESQVTYLKQLGYHLDGYIMPGPNGSIYMHDYQEVINSVDIALANDQVLSRYERVYLLAFKRNAQVLQERMGGVVEYNEKVLSDGGFDVIKLAGVYDSNYFDQELFLDEAKLHLGSESKANELLYSLKQQDLIYFDNKQQMVFKVGEYKNIIKTIHGFCGDFETTRIITSFFSNSTVNYMNAITGTGNKGKFFITNGSNIPRLNMQFSEAISKQGIDNVYFVGKKSNTQDFWPALNSIKFLSGGVQCRTIDKAVVLNNSDGRNQ